MSRPDPATSSSDQPSEHPGRPEGEPAATPEYDNTPQTPGTPDVSTPYRISSDRRVWLILGIVAMLLSCCCVSATVITLTWGDDIYRLVRQ